MSARVSIIIPTFNRAGYLPQAVDSALAQDYPDIEVVISDNASDDDTAEVIKPYLADRRVRYHRNPENLGMVPNWHKALFEYSTGDWALILGDDDFLLSPTYVSKAMALAAEDPGVVLVHANCRVLDEKSGTHTDTDKGLPRIVDGKWMFLNYEYAVRGNTNYDQLTVIFRRDVATEMDFFNDTILSSDRESFLKLTLHGKIGFVDDVASVYRIHGGNLFATKDLEKFFDNIRAVTNPYEYAKSIGAIESDELERWKRRMITEYAEIEVTGKMLSGKDKVEFMKAFTSRLYREYPFALVSLAKVIKPRFLAKLILGSRN